MKKYKKGRGRLVSKKQRRLVSDWRRDREGLFTLNGKYKIKYDPIVHQKHKKDVFDEE